ECYVPAAKRKYGYFCLPVLWRENLVGRIDLKAERQRKALLLQSLHFERGFRPDADFLAALAATLGRWRVFHGCDTVGFSDTISRKVRRQLTTSR
ncbi:MAG: winged helix DNA-binding domain-containing protein, partial [Candidatus Edwardsbacteria bacterium]|nr:winged helix DNA-binding domain-containing protein [Candidatus Edwardsbacteria bacterium]